MLLNFELETCYFMMHMYCHLFYS